MSDEKKKLIDEAVEKALAGDEEAINSIEDRVTRAKAKATLVKARRQGAVPDKGSPNDEKENGDDKPKGEDKINFHVSVRKKIADKFPDCLDDEQSDEWIQIKPENWLKIASWLQSDDELYFDSLQCNTGMDLGEGVLESRYNLHSMKHLHKIEVRIKVTNDKPNIPSVEQVWRVADWFERETYDMFGINFIGHRDLRRILLPEDWEGWPLRKDYQEQETYHGIVVPKVKEGWE